MRWYQRLFRRERVEKQLDAELRFHVEQQIADYVATGMTPEEARRRVRLEFGGLDQVKEECRDVGAVRFVESLIQDVRYGLRQLRRSPGFTAVAAITLALGIGANIAVFSVIYDVLLKPLPYPEPDRLVWIACTQPPWPANWSRPFSGPNFLDLERENRSFQYMAAMFETQFSLSGDGEPESVHGQGVTADFFKVLGVHPMLGRAFVPDEAQRGHNLEAVLSYGFWQQKFAGARGIIGKTLNLNQQTYTIVGVMPRGFGYPSHSNEIWVPLIVPKRHRWDDSYWAVGRLKPGIRLARARADVSTIAHRLAVEYPKSNDREGILLISLRHWLGWFIRPTLLILFAAVGLVLLIVCANVANLLLARGSTRQREMAVRVSLGATRRRLIVQMLVESLLLALVGGAAALLVGQWSIELIRALKPDNLPKLQQLEISLPVLWFTLLISILTGIIFGLAPAFQMSGAHLNKPLKSSGPRTGAKQWRARNVLVVTQVALSVLLLAGAGLMIRSFARFVGLDPGFAPDHLLRFEIELPRTEYSQVTQVKEFYRRALNRVRAIPGVESAAVSYPLPPAGDETDASFNVEGGKPASPSAEPDAIWHIITPGYFHTMRTEILKGRAFTRDDTSKSRPVIIINQTLMRHFFPHQDPIGRRLEVDANSKFATIVGVASDEAYAGWEHLYSNEIYFPLSQLPWLEMSFVVRTKVVPAAIGPEVRKEIWSVDKDLPVVGMETMQQSLDQAYTARRFDMALLLAFAVLGISVAAVGIYGVVSYQVAQRTHEIGIRMALGAQKSDVSKMVVGEGLKLALVGIAIGIIGSLGITRLLSSLLYGVKPSDPVTFIAVALILIGVALLACYIPARRAAKVDPMVALRHE